MLYYLRYRAKMQEKTLTKVRIWEVYGTLLQRILCT